MFFRANTDDFVKHCIPADSSGNVTGRGSSAAGHWVRTAHLFFAGVVFLQLASQFFQVGVLFCNSSFFCFGFVLSCLSHV